MRGRWLSWLLLKLPTVAVVVVDTQLSLTGIQVTAAVVVVVAVVAAGW